eukprot:TRINITY_DN12006_c0_g1_i2.p1 TRINITY_DN12006_c0_g1~~TRINITY_DN12006_c0_g1_i2.p1  ORF type:complete len:285 (-),score=61.97 TRINITY_DN12006_c0_g1_i2:882-1736(-)
MDPYEPFHNLDDLDSDECQTSSGNWAEQCGADGPDTDEPPPSPEPTAANPGSCLSPGSASRAMTDGAKTAMEEHMIEQRTKSIDMERRVSAAAAEAATDEEEEALWVRSMSGEHSLDARKSVYLQCEWDIYYDGGFQRGMSDLEWAASVKKLGTFHSVQLFWRYWNNLPLARLPSGSNVRFFKVGIQPTWDDPANREGGKWVIKPKDAESLFADIVISLIGGSMATADHVCGAIYSVRPKGVSLSVWNGNARDKAQVSAIGEELREMCDLANTGPVQDIRAGVR